MTRKVSEYLTWSMIKDRQKNHNFSEYNTSPEGLTEISKDQFMRNLFHYVFDKQESRQVCDGNNFKLTLFPLGYESCREKKMGFAIIYDWFDYEAQSNRNEQIYRFARYGKESDWKEFTEHFTNQFQGDNS